jgi:hypothetical protein
VGEVQTVVFTVILSKYTNPGPKSVPSSNDGWQPVIINKIYGTSFPVPSSISPGKNVGWGEWTHQP